MKNLIFICLALNLSGCVQWEEWRNLSKEPNQIEEILLLDSYLVYQKRFGMFTEDCAIQFQKTRMVSFETVEEVDTYCDLGQKDQRGTTYGCYHLDNGFAGSKGSPIITYPKEFLKYENIIFHEFAHWAEICMAGPGTNIEPHANKEIWGFVNTDPLEGLYENIKEEYK